MSATVPPSPVLKPDAVLAVGVSGGMRFDTDPQLTDCATRNLETVLIRLLHEVRRQRERGHRLFSAADARLRVVAVPSAGGGLCALRAGETVTSDLATVFPLDIERSRTLLGDPAAQAIFDRILAKVTTTIVMPGKPRLDDAYDRADHVLLDQSDLLLAIWNGPAASADAETALIQAAIDRRIPVIVIAPTEDAMPWILARPDTFLVPDKLSNLPRFSFDETIGDLVDSILSPPASPTELHALEAFYEEAPKKRTLRIEYRLFTLFAFSLRRRAPLVSKAIDAPAASCLQADLEILTHLQSRIDNLANYFGNVARSHALSQFFLMALIAVLVAVVSALAPDWIELPIILQLAATIVVLLDSYVRVRQRWQERWLDYRTVAEHLRTFQVLLPLGLAPVLGFSRKTTNRPWTDWYASRLFRGFSRIAIDFTPAAITAATERLQDIQIAGQISYHRAALAKFRVIERRLQRVSVVFTIATMIAAAVLLVTSHLGARWVAYLQLVLVALPVFVTAATGLVAQAELARFALRSVAALEMLENLYVTLKALPADVDRLRIAGRRAAAAMTEDSTDWRRTLEHTSTRSADYLQTLERAVLAKSTSFLSQRSPPL